MRQEIHLHAYDVMDQVQVSIRYACQDDMVEGPPVWETLVATRFQSTGETDGRSWVQDALVAALEAL